MAKGDGTMHIEGPRDVWHGMGVLEILATAIYNEQSACELYSGLAETIANQQGQATFRGLAEDEKRHRRLLEIRYRDESKGKIFPFDSQRVKKINLSVDNQAKAIDAVELALAAEKNASELYHTAARRTQDAEGKRMFESLAADEDQHHEILLAERQALLGHPYWFSADEQRLME